MQLIAFKASKCNAVLRFLRILSTRNCMESKRSSTGKNTAFTGPEHYFDISEAKRCNISISKLVS